MCHVQCTLGLHVADSITIIGSELYSGYILYVILDTGTHSQDMMTLLVVAFKKKKKIEEGGGGVQDMPWGAI